jgi:hypothetical protein
MANGRSIPIIQFPNSIIIAKHTKRERERERERGRGETIILIIKYPDIVTRFSISINIANK